MPPNNIGIHVGQNATAQKSLHIDGFFSDQENCADPAIRLSFQGQPDPYWGHLALITPHNPGYSMIATEKDLILQADYNAEDLIITTRSNTGSIRFTTTPGSEEEDPDIERMTIIDIGHVGIFETDPREPLQIGQRLTFHCGANNDFIGYNEYVNVSAERRRIIDGFASCLNFTFNGNVYLGSAGTGDVDSEVSYYETSGGFKGITVNNINDIGHIGIGAFGWENNRLTVRGMGNTDATNTLEVMNSDMATSFIVRDDRRVGIRNSDPKDILQVGSEITFHDGGTKSIRINSYYDQVAGYSKNISSVRPSLQIGTAAPEGDNGAYIFIDKKEQIGEELWQGYGSNGYMKGLKLLSNGNVGICQVDPTSRLVVRGAGNTDQTSAFNVVNSDGTSLFFVRDDGNVGIGVASPEQKLAVNGKVRIGTETITSGDHTDYMLSVDGKIVTEVIVVTLDGWSDFVFERNYKLKTIEELEKYIIENKHLPNIPKKEEILKEGVNLGEMQAKLLQKIEELTLYVIELKKENDELEKMLNKINFNIHKK